MPYKRSSWLAVLMTVLGGCVAGDSDLGSPGGTGVAVGLESQACQYPGSLEITSVNVGQGSATIIATPTSLVLADVGESYWNSHADAAALDQVLMEKYGCRTIDYVVISHLHVDHIGYVGYGGLWYLANVLGYEIGATLLRDYSANVGATGGTYDNWVAYLETAEARAILNPRTAVVGEQIDLGDGIQITISNVDTRSSSCPDGWGSAQDGSCGGAYSWPSAVLGDHRGDASLPSENDYGVGLVVSVGDFDMFIGGDIDGETVDSSYGTSTHDIESYVARDVGEVDVFHVNHHGSDHSNHATIVSLLDPQVGVISVGNANTYGHSRQAAIDRILGVVGGVPTRDTWLYMTERGDDGLGGCLADYSDSHKAAALLYGRATIVSDTDGDYCTVEGGDVDIVVAPDGATFTVEDDSYTSLRGAPPACDGDGLCEVGEDCHSCPSDCSSGEAATCGNGVCETANGEDCLVCPDDCAGRQNGRESRQFCCGDGSGMGPVDCSDPRCTEDGLACLSDPVAASCCGDGTCDGLEDGYSCELDCGPPPVCGDGTCDPDEDRCSCEADCGTPPAAEAPGATCGDGVDNDCDGLADCDDVDCINEPACAPPPCDGDGTCEAGEDCLSCPSDCDGRDTGRPSARFCCGDGVEQEAEGDGSICDSRF